MDHPISDMDTSFPNNASDELGNFECNICFELPQEPIVTLCGHLYCWPCLYQWLHLHSHSHECPICKAVVHEEKLIPIHGRGKPYYDPRSYPIPGVTVLNQPTWPSPQTGPDTGGNSVQESYLDPMVRFMPMAAARFGHATLSTLFAALPSIFNLRFDGLRDATIYGTTSGVPDSVHSSFHGDYYHRFNDRLYHSHPVEWKPVAWKTLFVVLGAVVFLQFNPLTSFIS